MPPSPGLLSLGSVDGRRKKFEEIQFKSSNFKVQITQLVVESLKDCPSFSIFDALIAE